MDFIKQATVFALSVWTLVILVGIMRPIANRMGQGELVDYACIGIQIFVALWLCKHLTILTKALWAAFHAFGAGQ